MIKAVIYTRVSTDEQVQGYSLEKQGEECIKKAIELGCHTWEVYEDAGISGEAVRRPALFRALRDMRNDEGIKFFICFDTDRLSRTMLLQQKIVEEIERTRRVTLQFVRFTKENTPTGKLMFGVKGLLGEFEKEVIRERTMDGKLIKAQQHKWTHWPGIYGYNYDKETEEVTVNEEQAKVIKLMFGYGAEMGVKNIADRLALMGIPSPRRKSLVWSHTTIRRILDNETYYTGVTHIQKQETYKTYLNKYVEHEEDKAKRIERPREEWIEMHVPPIIDEATFMAAHRRRVVSRRQSESNQTQRFLLSGLLRCGQCGKTWHGFSNTRQGRRVTYYVCTYKSPGPPKGSGLAKCDTNFMVAQEFEDTIWKEIRSWLEDDGAIEKFHASIRRPENVEPTSEMEFLHHRQKQLEAEESNLVGLVRTESSKRLRDKLQLELHTIADELDRIEAMLNEIEKPSEEMAVTVNQEIINEIREEYADPNQMTWEEKYSVIHRLVRSIEVIKTGRRYTLRIALLH